MKSIIILCPFPVGMAAGQRLKYEQYITEWQAQGYRVRIMPFMTVKMWRTMYPRQYSVSLLTGLIQGYLYRIYCLLFLPFCDIVYIFMWGTPIGPPIYEHLVRMLSKRIIYDVEDSILDPQKGSRIFCTSYKANYLARVADHVIASSPALADRCRDINTTGASTYITSSVSMTRYKQIKYGQKAVPVLGWTGTYSSVKYLEMLSPVLQSLAKKSLFKLIVIGNFSYEIPGVDVEVITWKASTEIDDLARIDIGLYPLLAEEWVSGKSGLKAIQYMAMGIPTVASALGNTTKIIEHMESGVLCYSHNDWILYLTMLIDNPHLREYIGKNGRRQAKMRFSTTVVLKQYLQILNSL